MSDLPREARHDMAVELVHAWRDRETSERRWDLTRLGVTVGMRVFVELRDGTRHEGTVRARSGGERWWEPEEHDGCVVLDPSGESIHVDDVVAVGALPDASYSHESEGAVTDDHVAPPHDH